MVQMIALDLDGTLLQPDSTLSATAEDALTKAISQGICIVVASGRAFTALPEKIRHFAGIRYAVTSNGAAVSELPAGKLLKMQRSRYSNLLLLNLCCRRCMLG